MPIPVWSVLILAVFGVLGTLSVDDPQPYFEQLRRLC
jgi:hypothetical protein